MFFGPGREVSLAAPANLGIVCTLPKSYCQFIQVMILAIFDRVQFFKQKRILTHCLATYTIIYEGLQAIIQDLFIGSFSRAFQKLLDSYLGASKQIEVSNAGGRLHQTRQKLHNWRSTVRVFRTVYQTFQFKWNAVKMRIRYRPENIIFVKFDHI